MDDAPVGGHRDPHLRIIPHPSIHPWADAGGHRDPPLRGDSTFTISPVGESPCGLPLVPYSRKPVTQFSTPGVGIKKSPLQSMGIDKNPPHSVGIKKSPPHSMGTKKSPLQSVGIKKNTPLWGVRIPVSLQNIVKRFLVQCFGHFFLIHVHVF
jgi:hypothetical protein